MNKLTRGNQNNLTKKKKKVFIFIFFPVQRRENVQKDVLYKMHPILYFVAKNVTKKIHTKDDGADKRLKKHCRLMV